MYGGGRRNRGGGKEKREEGRRERDPIHSQKVDPLPDASRRLSHPAQLQAISEQYLTIKYRLCEILSVQQQEKNDWGCRSFGRVLAYFALTVGFKSQLELHKVSLVEQAWRRIRSSKSLSST